MTTISSSLESDGCICKIGSTPRRDVDGAIRCWQNDVFHITECITKAPNCICTGVAVQVLETDKEVTCYEIDYNNIMRKWPCENKQDWLLYLSAKKDNDAKQEEAVIALQSV